MKMFGMGKKKASKSRSVKKTSRSTSKRKVSRSRSTKKVSRAKKPAKKAKKKGGKRAAFGGYSISFAGRQETVEQVFGKGNLPPSQMTKLLWKFIKAKRLASK